MKKAVILDTSAIMYRTHFALMGMRNSKGLATGATYGFVNTLEGVLKEFSPDYLVACLDVKRSELKRSAELETYKAHRESMPDDLVAQQEYIMSVLDGYRIPKYKIDGYEADDVMSTLATKFSEDTEEEIEVYVVTGDKDLAQLVNGKINIALLGKGDKKNSLFKYIRTNEDVIEYLKQHITLTDFLGWEEDREYNVFDERYKIINNKLINLVKATLNDDFQSRFFKFNIR